MTAKIGDILISNITGTYFFILDINESNLIFVRYDASDDLNYSWILNDFNKSQWKKL